MKALELLKSGDKLLLPDSIESKKMQALASTLNELMTEMIRQINSFADFASSQLNGEYNDKIIVAKSLAKFFEGNKLLKVDMAVTALENEEKAKLNEYYSVKTKLLDTIRTILNNSSKDAVVSNYDLFEGEFVKCELGHEIIILNGRNTAVLETLISELDKDLIVNGNFSSVNAQEVDYNLDTLNRNIGLCERKNNEIYGSKTGRLNKITAIISKLREVGEKVVAFYSYKESLELIGCNPKGIKDYENELSKNYIPLKKTLQKELRIELEDICDIKVNEDSYPEMNVESPTPSSEFTAPLADKINTFDNANTIAEPAYDNYTTDNSIFTDDTTQNSNTTFESQSEYNTFSNNDSQYSNDVAESQPSVFTTNETFNTEQYNAFERESQYNTFGNAESENDTFASSSIEPTETYTEMPNNSFENVERPNPFDSLNNADPFENATHTSPFDNAQNIDSFENKHNVDPFEDRVNIDPFENNNKVDPFENTQRVNPFDITSNNPFADNKYANPFENNTRPNPFDDLD